MAGRPLRRLRINGVIQIPEKVFSLVQAALQSALLQLSAQSWDSDSPPSSKKDPAAQDRSRRVRRGVSFDGLTVYGRPVPDLLLEVRRSVEGYERSPSGASVLGGFGLLDAKRDAQAEANVRGYLVAEGVGWSSQSAFPDWYARASAKNTIPIIILAASLRTLQEPKKSALEGPIAATLRHELRHFIQYIISSDEATRPIPPQDVQRGGPPRFARVRQTRSSEPETERASIDRYYVSDVEFQPHIATIAEKYAKRVRDGETPERALRRAAQEELLRFFQKKDPEKWKAAIGIIATEIHKVPRYSSGKTGHVETSAIPSPVPSPWNRLGSHYFAGKNFENTVIPSTTDLSYSDFSRANLRGANLRSVSFRHAAFKDADLTGANLTEADLSGALLTRANLHSANISGANLHRAVLSGADMTRASCWRAKLGSAILNDAQLTRTNFHYSDLESAELVGANLTRTNLAATNLRGADLRRARMMLAILADSDLTGANLSGATLNSYTDLTNANMSNTTCTNTDFSEANIKNANFSGADLRGANFKNSYHYETARMSGAIMDERTILPDGSPYKPR